MKWMLLLVSAGCDAQVRSDSSAKSTTETAYVPGEGDLIITEVMANPAKCTDAMGEWFEVFNTTGSPVKLDGMLFGRTDLGCPSSRGPYPGHPEGRGLSAADIDDLTAWLVSNRVSISGEAKQ